KAWRAKKGALWRSNNNKNAKKVLERSKNSSMVNALVWDPADYLGDNRCVYGIDATALHPW
ncbi:MAG: hypothetical protein M1356_08785, partial [Gammaproteobacteria bacterium]|nr:hypothetical protein [Gammaproteobacteria bacterium]